VELDDDITKSVLKVLGKPAYQRDADDQSELSLAFVCTTRHKHELINATFLQEVL